MRTTCKLALLLCLFAGAAAAQGFYQEINVSNGGTISGTVKWSGSAPRPTMMPITKDVQVCDPEGHKQHDLERLIIGADGGVANTVVFLKNVSSGKAMDLPAPRRFLDQKNCRYEPHILVVPANGTLQMRSSDAVLHTVHMDGAATYNLPFPFPGRMNSRSMPNTGVANVRCNGGHVWMNAEVFIVSHPYYAVTDESGHFELTNVPPGDYELVAWHEGWNVLRREGSFDVLTERRVDRPVFSEPKTWEKSVTVRPSGNTIANFQISEK